MGPGGRPALATLRQREVRGSQGIRTPVPGPRRPPDAGRRPAQSMLSEPVTAHVFCSLHFLASSHLPSAPCVSQGPSWTRTPLFPARGHPLFSVRAPSRPVHKLRGRLPAQETTALRWVGCWKGAAAQGGRSVVPLVLRSGRGHRAGGGQPDHRGEWVLAPLV